MHLVHETVSHEHASQLDEARAWVERESDNADVEVRAADLSLMSGARGLADAIARDHDHLDVLVNNAGAQFGGERAETAEGHERTFAINTLAPFLLTNLLLPLLERSESARVVTVSSESYRQAGRPKLMSDGSLVDPELTHGYSMARAYGSSKLHVWWLMRALDRRLRERGVTNVTVNTVEPGSAFSGLQRDTLRRKRIGSTWISRAGEDAIWSYCECACADWLG